MLREREITRSDKTITSIVDRDKMHIYKTKNICTDIVSSLKFK